MKKSLWGLPCLLACGLLLTSCVDDAWSVDGDIDMTMQLGSEGLSLKLGNSENVYLRDILTVDADNNIDTLASGLYYLVETGQTDVDFNIDPVTTNIDPATLSPTVEIVNYEKVATDAGVSDGTAVPVERGKEYSETVTDARDDFNVNVTDISDDIRRIRRVVPQSGRFRLHMYIEQTQDGHFAFSSIRNVRLFLPSFARSAQAPNGIFEIGDVRVTPGQTEVDLGTIDIDEVVFGGEEGVPITGGALHENGEISMAGDFTFVAERSFEMNSDDYANVCLSVEVDGNHTGYIEVSEIEGEFAPEIEPDVEPLRIGDDLPDFLQDDRVRVVVSNPTLRFDVDMTQMPVDLNFKATATSMTDSVATTSPVDLPAAGTQDLDLMGGRRNVVYFYQGDSPFDVEPVPAGAVQRQVNNLSSLVERLPDEVRVDLGNGRVQVKPEIYTLRPDQHYTAGADYKVLVPLRFNAGLCVVYNDSVDDMHSDLKDYEADGVTVTATAVNTIPLELLATVRAFDLAGQEIPGFEVSEAKIAPAVDGQPVSTDFTLTIHLRDRADLKRLETMRFEVTATASASDELNSQQYVRFENMRLRLNGPITGDFN